MDHDDVAQQLRESMEWPQYYSVGEGVDEDGFVPAYYKVEGPNGPVSYVNPEGEPYPTTMYEFAMEAQSNSFRWCKKEETPWVE